MDSLFIGEVSLAEECLSSLLRSMVWEGTSSGWLLIDMVPLVGECFTNLLRRVRERSGFAVAEGAELSMDDLCIGWLSLISIWSLDKTFSLRIRVEKIEDSSRFYLLRGRKSREFTGSSGA